MKVLHPPWMPVQTMKMRGSQEALLLNQSESSLASSRSSINQYEYVSSGQPPLNQKELVQKLKNQSELASGGFPSYMSSNRENSNADYLPCTTTVPGLSKMPFQRRFSMQLTSNSMDNLKSYSRRAASRRGSIPCINTATELSSPLKTSQTAPNPFPELINSPPPTPISHGRSHSSCIDDRLTYNQDGDPTTSEDSYGYINNTSHVNSETVTPADSFSCLPNSASNGSISSYTSTTPILQSSSMSQPSNNYVHSSVIAARAKHLLQQQSHSSPASPAFSRRRSSPPDSSLANGVVTGSMIDNSGAYMSTSGYSSVDSRKQSPSDSPNGSTGRISPERLTCLYEQATALWSAEGYTKQMLMVYTDENNYKTVTIEENMVARDVSLLLADKSKVIPDKSWCIVERLPKFNLERSLEDHELVYAIYRSWGNVENNRFIFQKDFKKYELFNTPAQFLPPHMLDWKENHQQHQGSSPKTSPKLSQKSLSSVAIERHTNLLFQNLLSDSERLPDIQGNMYMKEGRRSWKKHFFVLRSSGLYYSAKGNSKDPKHLVLYSHLNEVNIYTAKNSKKVLGSPNNYCICLKPLYCVNDAKELKLLCAEDENSRMCWMAALRLIKYGSQLKENYKKAMKIEAKQHSTDSNEAVWRTYGNSKLNVKSRVAMDFTGPGGRVVDNPNEAIGVAIEEGQHWRKKSPRGHHSPALAESPCQATGLMSENPSRCPHGLQSGVHITQPWFHSGIGREEAVALIQNDGLVDGVFLVRESQSIPDSYVLSMAHNGKVKHCTIKTVCDCPPKSNYPCDEEMHFSMDGGHTKFIDLIQLVEFYQLNANGLPTRLTHYITRIL